MIINIGGKTFLINILLNIILVFQINTAMSLTSELLPTDNKSEDYSRHKIETQLDSLEYFMAMADKYSSSNLTLSDSLINNALSLYSKNKINNDTLLSECYHIMGKTLVNRKSYEKGIETLFKSLRIKEKHIKTDYASISKTKNYIGIGYLGEKKYDSAYYYFNQSKSLLINNKIRDINLFYIYHNLAILNAELGKYNNTTKYLDSALVVIKDSQNPVDSLMIAYYYNSLALFTTFTGNLNKANCYFEKAEKIFQNRLSNDNISLALLNNNKGVNSFHNHDLSKAELYYKKALYIYLNNEDVENAELPKIYYNLSQISLAKKNYIASINYCLEGLENDPNLDLQLILNNNLAKAYQHINDYNSASKHFATALKILTNKDINKKRYYEIYLSYADFLKVSNNNNKALEFYLKAVSSSKQVFDTLSEQTALTLIRTADHYLDCLDDPNTAIHFYNKAIDILKEINESNSLKNTSAIYLTNALSGKGRSYLLLYDKNNDPENLHKADKYLSDALEIFENVSSKLNVSDKLILIDNFDNLYDLQINNLLKLYSIFYDSLYMEKAFVFMEKSKSSALLSSVNTEHALKTSDLPDDLFQFEHTLKDNINGLNQLLEREKLNKTPDSKKVNYFEKSLLDNMKKYDSLISYLEHNFPKYYSLKYNSNVISLKEIKEYLEPDELVIEYHFAPRKITIASICKDDFTIKQIDIDSSFHQALDYILNIKETNFNNENKASFYKFKKYSHYLWEKLILPIEESTNNKRLIIIPDGKLGYLPFDLLTQYDFEFDGINYRDLPYLINDNPISYAYSANLLFNTYFNSENRLTKVNLIAFAPEYGNNSLSGNDAYAEKLRFAKQEAQSIVNNYGGILFSDSNANKENFKAQAPESKILHLAMHAIINDSLPLQSRMIFSSDSNDNMFAHEVFNLDLNADMVVLSACNTGSGKLSTGEGIISMARGFLYAGVPSIVMTLWEAQDETGASIMENYYKYLSQNLPKDKALQMAKKEVLRDSNMAKSHPFFWSSYIISGDTKPITLSTKPDNTNIVFLAISIIAIYLISRFISSKIKNKKATKEL